jgi:hypothetical protein
MRTILKNISAAFMFLSIGCNDQNIGPVSDGSVQGTGGSMARFAVKGDYLYTVDMGGLNLFDISTPANPEKIKRIPLSFGVETIFPFNDMLFIGTQTGMQILSITDPAAPQHISEYEHVIACDPVVTDGMYAYVTLSSGIGCRPAVNQLQVVDIRDVTNPRLVKQYGMVNPKGLGIDKDLLFVCDDGLKVYDASKAPILELKNHYKDVTAYDVIASNGRVMLIGTNGFYQYTYKDENLTLLSKITVQRKF